MIISHIVLKNWRNFRSVEVDLRDRVLIVSPNACGKSNFFDALRFLRDLAKNQFSAYMVGMKEPDKHIFNPPRQRSGIFI